MGAKRRFQALDGAQKPRRRWLLPSEDEQAFDALVDRMSAPYVPLDVFDELYVEQAARAEWERRRAQEYLDVLVEAGLSEEVRREMIFEIGAVLERNIAQQAKDRGRFEGVLDDIQRARDLTSRSANGDAGAGIELEHHYLIPQPETIDERTMQARAFLRVALSQMPLEDYIEKKAAIRDRAIQQLEKRRYQRAKTAVAYRLADHREAAEGSGVVALPVSEEVG